ncbi:MAG: hypothetical protein Q4D65_01805 [Peptostreptococcaceae bacterium]|nr:hypothetical protein [Peptostreptococcaceae bacterium]
MKKYTKWILFLIGILLITGCKPNTPDEKSTTNPPEQETTDSVQKEFKPMDEREIKTLIQDRLLKAERVTKIFWADGLGIDKSQSIDLKIGEYPQTYHLVKDEEVKTVSDIEKMLEETFTQRMISQNYRATVAGNFARFAEKDGKLYTHILEGLDPPRAFYLKWDMENLEVGYQSEDRIVVYAKATSASFTQEGKIVLHYENGQWLLDTDSYLESGIPFDATYELEESDYVEEPKDFRKTLVDYAGQEKNGYRLPKPISEYVTEIDEYPYFIRDFNLNFHQYYGINIYSLENHTLKLQDKMFLPKEGEKTNTTVLPLSDKNGILQLNYAQVEKEEKEDTIAGHVTYGAMDEQMYYNLQSNFWETSTRD